MSEITLTRKQEEALKLTIDRYRHHEPYTVISGYAGSGKAQPNDTLIPTPSGYKKLGSLQVGDLVFDRLGQPTKVLGIYPQGEKEVYQVTLRDGRTTLCCGEHLWTVKDKHNRFQTKTTLELLTNGLTNSGGYKYALPMSSPVEYSHKDFSIHPYVIGAFLGDGCNLQTLLTISSENEEIPNIIGQLIDATPHRQSAKNYNWIFSWKNSKMVQGKYREY